MVTPDNLRHTKLPLNNGSGAIPALGFGTLIPDPDQRRNQHPDEVQCRCGDRRSRIHSESKVTSLPRRPLREETPCSTPSHKKRPDAHKTPGLKSKQKPAYFAPTSLSSVSRKSNNVLVFGSIPTASHSPTNHSFFSGSL